MSIEVFASVSHPQAVRKGPTETAVSTTEEIAVAVCDSTDEKKATMTSSWVNMTNTVLGTGLLAIPRTLAMAGWVAGIILLAVCAGLSGMTNYFIMESAATTSPRPA